MSIRIILAGPSLLRGKDRIDSIKYFPVDIICDCSSLLCRRRWHTYELVPVDYFIVSDLNVPGNSPR